MNCKMFRELIGGAAMACFLAVSMLHVNAWGNPVDIRSPVGGGSLEDRELESLLAYVLQKVADRFGLAEGQTAVQISTSLSVSEGLMLIELGRDAVTSSAEASEEQCHALTTEAYVLLRDFISIPDIRCVYGGREIGFYNPDPISAHSQEVAAPVGEEAANLVMISAGHGYFFNPISKKWETRRPLVNDVQEDFITPKYAWSAAQYVLDRLQYSVAMARSDSAEVHAESGHPWWKMSARTWLQSRLEDHPEIWDSLSNDGSPDGQEKDDIRARPLFANYVGADYSLHIHTNGADNDSARGTVGIYQRGRNEDAEYARKILCSMEEVIHAVPNYADWRVDVTPRPGNYGELRLTSPDKRAALVEVGFHSNGADAAALKNPAFRAAAAAGMVKGIRLHREGKMCEKFQIDDMPNVTSPVNDPFKYSIAYSGNPTFPVVIHSESLECPPGWFCVNHNIEIVDPQESPIVRNYKCISEPWQSGVFRWRRWLVDADGVKTDPVDHTISCTATSSK